jgi:hypothetical protein
MCKLKNYWLLISPVCLGLIQPCCAMYEIARIQKIPIDRLLANLQQEEQLKPDNKPQIEFRLARLYAMSYAMSTHDIPTYEALNERAETKNDKKAPEDKRIIHSANAHEIWPDYRQDKVTISFAPVIAQDSLHKAIEHYRIAYSLTPSDNNVKLGLAWCLVQSKEYAEAIPMLRSLVALDDPKPLLGDRKNLQYEAAQYLAPLLNTQSDGAELKTLRALPLPDYEPHFITPVVVPLNGKLNPSELMIKTKVKFDLGLGSRCYTSWPSKKAGWLVYDQQGTRKIDSGLQLFGNYTFFLFWKDGYEAMSSLDDNHDGKLSGRELRHLAVWQDKNADGKSDKSEVLRLESLSVKSIACKSSALTDGVLNNEKGITFFSGETRATYDFILQEESNVLAAKPD